MSRQARPRGPIVLGTFLGVGGLLLLYLLLHRWQRDGQNVWTSRLPHSLMGRESIRLRHLLHRVRTAISHMPLNVKDRIGALYCAIDVFSRGYKHPVAMALTALFVSGILTRRTKQPATRPQR